MNKKNWLIILIVVLISFVIWSYQNNEESVSLNPPEISEKDHFCLVQCRSAHVNCRRTASILDKFCRDFAEIIFNICADFCPSIRLTGWTSWRECYDDCRKSYGSDLEDCKRLLKENRESCDEQYEDCKNDCPPLTQR